MKRTFILLGACVSLIGLPETRGQSTLNAGGGTGIVTGHVCDWSVGEMTMVATFIGSSVTVTQGVLQNDTLFNTGVKNTGLATHMQVFPNPASSLVNMQFNASEQGTLGYRLMDATGKLIRKCSYPVLLGVTTQQIDISELANATYFLEVIFKAENSNAEMTSYKIDKLK